MRELTKRENEVYNYITDACRELGYAPSVRDIRDALGFKSTSTVHMYIQRLAELGLISKDDGKSRAIKIENTAGVYKVPILGRVTAGNPILADEEFDGFVSFYAQEKGYRSENLFALRIKGDSMKDAGILDGDIVVVDKRSVAENGEIVVALLNDEATVKAFYRENGHYRLQPYNENYTPLIVDDVLILGKVVASFRYYI